MGLSAYRRSTISDIPPSTPSAQGLRLRDPGSRTAGQELPLNDSRSRTAGQELPLKDSRSSAAVRQHVHRQRRARQHLHVDVDLVLSRARATSKRSRRLPTAKSSTVTRLIPSGRLGDSATRPRGASASNPSAACSNRNGAAAAHAWGMHATGYHTGPSRSAGHPPNSSGSRRSRSKDAAA